MEWLAAAAFGLEGVVKQELAELGLTAKAHMGGARFEGTPEDAFRANLWLRCADRVLLIAGEGEARSFEELFQLAKSIPWEDLLPRDARFPVTGNCARSQLMSVRDCQAIIKKAVAERLGQKYGESWLKEDGADYPIAFSIHQDQVRLALDTSGDALNKRGYRTWVGEAPLRETLAAALVRLSPWQPGQPLHDPTCCCGDFLIAYQLIMLFSRILILSSHMEMPKNQANSSRIANVKLLEGKMHTPGQCKTISNGIFGIGAQKHLDRVLSGDSRIKNAVNPES